MPDIKKMFEVCNYVIKNNATILDVCEKFDISRRTAQKYTGEYLRNYANSTDDELARNLIVKLEEIKKSNEQSTQTKKVDVDLDEVIAYIISAKTTIEEASLMFGVSESTVHKYIAYIKENDQELYARLLKAQEEISKRGHILGGKTSVRGPKYTDFESVEIVETMIDEELTVKEASMRFEVPSSSIYERVKAVDDEEIQGSLQEMFDNRKKKK